MGLLAYQTALGRQLRAAGANTATLPIDPPPGVLPGCEELGEITALVRGPDFAFTRSVQRSWCRGRTAEMAGLTLSMLPGEQRRQLIEGWVEQGGGTALDPALEAEAFLEFVAGHLRNPSHELTVCRTEQAVRRASAASLRFVPRDPLLLDYPRAALRRSAGAALVRFLADPDRLLAAVATRDPLPPLAAAPFPILFAPGLATLWRPAGQEEARLWDRLAVPGSPAALLREGYARCAISRLFEIGAIDGSCGWLARPACRWPCSSPRQR